MGFYDTGEEADRTKEMREQFRPQTLEELEGRRRQVGRSQAGCEGQAAHASSALACPL